MCCSHENHSKSVTKVQADILCDLCSRLWGCSKRSQEEKSYCAKRSRNIRIKIPLFPQPPAPDTCYSFYWLWKSLQISRFIGSVAYRNIAWLHCACRLIKHEGLLTVHQSRRVSRQCRFIGNTRIWFDCHLMPASYPSKSGRSSKVLRVFRNSNFGLFRAENYWTISWCKHVL